MGVRTEFRLEQLWAGYSEVISGSRIARRRVKYRTSRDQRSKPGLSGADHAPPTRILLRGFLVLTCGIENWG